MKPYKNAMGNLLRHPRAKDGSFWNGLIQWTLETTLEYRTSMGTVKLEVMLQVYLKGLQ
jgi:hypothetical protein